MNEQEALRDAVRSLLEKGGGWQRLCQEIGVAGLLIPEEHGGAGAGLDEACIVLEELGRNLTSSPMLGTVLATQALLDTGQREHLPAIAAGEKTPALVWGEYTLDPGDIFLVARGDQLYEVPSAEVEPLETMDASRNLARVRPLGEGRLLGSFDNDRLLAVACRALAAEQVGAMTRALELTVEYTKTRVQFGRPIGSFQALQHRMADLYVLVETARSAYLGCDPVIAKIYCSEAFQKVAAEMIQMHGGIGITWEHDAHRYFKRAHGSAELFGHPRTHIQSVWRGQASRVSTTSGGPTASAEVPV